MANWYVDSVGWTAVTAWAATTTLAVGALRRQLAAPTVGNERVFRVSAITTGITGGSEPSWTLTKGGSTSDSGVTWTEVTGNETYQTGGVWAAPHARLSNAFSWGAAGDTFFVGDDHAETTTAGFTLTSPGTAASPCSVRCVDHTKTPPGTGDQKTTAIITNTGTTDNNVNGYAYYYGITLQHTGGGGGNIFFGKSAAAHSLVFEACVLKIGVGSASGCQISFGTTAGSQPCLVSLRNTQFSFNATGQSVNFQEVRFSWKNTASALVGAAVPTILFTSAGSNSGLAASIEIAGVDLSAAGSGKTLFGSSAASWNVFLEYCKLGASVVVAATPAGPGYATIDAVSCDSAGTGYQKYRYWYQGTLTTETTIIRTGGVSDGTTGISDKIATTANALWDFSFQSLPIAVWNAVTGTNRIVTLAGIWNAAAVPNNDDIWIEVRYFGSASSPQASFASNTKANNLATGSALTADSTSAWVSLVTARANTTAYSLGDVSKVASNPGRIFFCTTAGTSAGSEPVGYAGAVDGGSVTDGTAVFRAGVRFLLTVTLSSPQPAMAGPIYVTVNAAKISSTFYVDPLIVLS